MRPTERRHVRQFASALETASSGEGQLLPLARLATSLSGGAALVGPSDDFRLALRQRLLAVGAVSNTRPASRPTEAAAWRRRLVAAGAVLTIATGGIAATAVASTHALPGDRLYEVKRAVEDVQLALATSDLAKGERYLTIASTRLGEVQELLRRNAGQTDNPVVVQELRSTLSDMSEAIAAGSERFFAAFSHTTNAAVLVPLSDFVNRRVAALTDVGALLPAELLPKQDSLLGELRGIAARVATATGRPVTVDRTTHTALVRPAEPVRASRSHAEREQLSKFSLTPTVHTVDATVDEARRDAEAATTKNRAPQGQTEVERNVRHLVDVDLLDPAGNPSIDGMPADSDGNDSQAQDFMESADTWRSTYVGSGSSSGMALLGLLPLPSDSIDAGVPGSLTASLDFTDARLGGKYAHLRADR